MYKIIVAAFAFSEPGRAAVRVAVELARHHGARLHVFHALDYKLLHLSPESQECSLACSEAEARFAADHGQELAGVDAVFVCRPADPAMGVCKLARDLGADLLVIGVHQGKLARMSYTGITIMEKSPCQVLLVPAKD